MEVTPMPLMAILDSSFDLLRNEYRPLLLLSALFYLPAHVLCYALEAIWMHPDLQVQDLTSDVLLRLVGKFLLIGLPSRAVPGALSLCVLLVASGPLCLYILSLLLGESPPSFWQAVRQGIGPAFRLIPLALIVIAVFLGGLFFMQLLFLVIVSVVIWAAHYLFASDVTTVVTIVLSFVDLFVSLLMAVGIVTRYFLFACPLIVYEKLPVGAVWERNATLLSRSQALKLWISITLLLPVLLCLQVAALSPLNYVFEYFSFPPLLSDPLQSLISFCVTLILFLYILIVVVRIYVDCRVRREALDIRLLAQRLYPKEEPS
ncbi:hypothetical protein CTKA_02604 [Chthonomonas calidirosea]|uniref:Glycerophosphoryl diester phosphodiesterase membrane domain-containing protein n=1 Tax=Chthonomonas calidirosea (strain DSM 23976 / ICMP 18418 / T49) TaxID=1303518 RepID=S0EYY7_CHTCT|nr:hypothetical protein [Chthonomonas calidirosea]CCW35311.1 hypothetical protein CCALI_01495 [Chthonomonas calidirosea T49]CEK20641.1 hypothetical protein CTKA_02604 [Chthonomonas calidirosea]